MKGDNHLWRAETVGFHSCGSDPVKVANPYLQEHENWSKHSRSLGSFRSMMLTCCVRLLVPMGLFLSLVLTTLSLAWDLLGLVTLCLFSSSLRDDQFGCLRQQVLG